MDWIIQQQISAFTHETSLSSATKESSNLFEFENNFLGMLKSNIKS